LGYAFAFCVFLLFFLSRSFSLFALLSLKSQLLVLSAPSIPGACALIGIRRRFSISLLPVDFFLLRCFFPVHLRHFLRFQYMFCTGIVAQDLGLFSALILSQIFRCGFHAIWVNQLHFSKLAAC